MSALRDYSLSTFERELCSERSEKVHVIDICTYPTANPLFREHTVEQIDLVSHLRSTPQRNKDEDARASLKLVLIFQYPDGSLGISYDIFLEVFRNFNLEPYILSLIRQNIQGFNPLSVQGYGPANGDIRSFYVNAAAYSLIWSFDVRTSTTRAFLLPKIYSRLDEGKLVNRFCKVLCQHQKLLDNPMILGVIFGILVMERVSSRLRQRLRLIRSTEAQTGHGPWAGGLKPKWPDLGKLTELSADTGSALAIIADTKRSLEIVRSLLMAILEEENCTGHHAKSLITQAVIQPAIQPIHQPTPQPVLAQPAASISATTQSVVETACLLLPQINSAKIDAEYLEERGKIQMSVLFNLINREDARTAKEIAEAAKKDGSSMKTIAIMTMIFLPATFFAALFAVPSLQWNSERIVTDRFRLYWAFTIPATVLVLTLWAVITNWSYVKHKLRGKKTEVTEKGDKLV